MAKSLNMVQLIGRLGKDAEMRITPGGKNVTTFSLATNREWKTDGEKRKSTEWHTIVAWGKLGEICNQFLKKGMLVYVQGYIKYEQWEDNGEKKYFTKIVIQEMTMLGDKNGNGHYEGDDEEDGTISSNDDDMSDALPAEDDIPF